ncbi:hypothetical protein FKM82_020881 [Ascaphus truei]
MVGGNPKAPGVGAYSGVRALLGSLHVAEDLWVPDDISLIRESFYWDCRQQQRLGRGNPIRSPCRKEPHGAAVRKQVNKQPPDPRLSVLSVES